MKKHTACASIALLALAFSAGTALAQVSATAGAEAQVNEGGLGKGLSNMVRGILGEQNSSGARYSAPPAEPSLMMQMDAAAQVSAPESRMAPQPMMMSMKAANADATIVAMSDEELRTYIHELILADSNIQSIDSSDTHVRITYAIPSRVFRLVKVTLRVTVGAQVSGRTEVSYPWYAFATARAASDLKADVSERVQPIIPDHPFTPDEQRMLIDEIHLTLAARLGSSTGGDR